MDKLFLVGCGGAVGAILRYMISLVPWKGEFPLLTLITNLAGAILIGLVVGLAFSKDTISPNIVLFFHLIISFFPNQTPITHPTTLKKI